MAESDIAICSRALLSIGADAVSSITDGSTDRGNTCNALYPALRDAVLGMHPWRFATLKVQLAQVAGTPTNEWDYAYQLPPDMIAGPYAVFNSATSARPMTDFEIFGDKLLTDETVIYIDYRYQPPESKFPPWFAELLVIALAGKLAPHVTEKAELAIEMNERAWGTRSEDYQGGWFGVCKTINAQANPSIQLRNDAITEARFS